MLGKLDTWLIEHPKRDDLHGWRRFAVEFWFFGLKEARACLFAGLFFIAMFLIPKTGWLGVSRYDLLLIFCSLRAGCDAVFQAGNVGTK